MNQPIFRRQAIYKDSFVISFFLCLLILAEFLPRSEQFLHWFVIPVTLSGILIGIDAIDWWRGRFNIFDPVGILGLLGFHFFFLAPLLHVRWDSWLEPWYTPPADWRPWLGYMAILNFFGICMYRLSRSPGFLKNKKKPLNQKKIWIIDQKRFPIFLSIALLISAVLQVFTYQKFGGVIAYINAAIDTESNQFQGMGVLFIVSESFPILALIGFAIYAQKYKRLRSLPILIGVLMIFFVLQMFFGGLRGSRANTIWALFWGLGIIHFWLRQVSKKEIAVGLVFLLFFMYFYLLLRQGGIEDVQNSLQEDRLEAEEKPGTTWKGLVLGDLGRSEVQAFVLYRIVRHNSDYEYAWGRTYFAATTIMIPSAILPNKPPDKSMEGTEVMSGKGSYNPQEPGRWVSSKVYGLAGEIMLNFGPLPVPFAFIVLGIIVGRVKRCLVTWDSSDIRLLLLPMMVNFCFIVLASDLDNDIFFLFKNAGFPVLVLWISSKTKVIDCEDRSRFLALDNQRYFAPHIPSKFQE